MPLWVTIHTTLIKLIWGDTPCEIIKHSWQHPPNRNNNTVLRIAVAPLGGNLHWITQICSDTKYARNMVYVWMYLEKCHEASDLQILGAASNHPYDAIWELCEFMDLSLCGSNKERRYLLPKWTRQITLQSLLYQAKRKRNAAYIMESWKWR